MVVPGSSGSAEKPLPALFSPLALRGFQAPNRLVWTAHSSGLSDGGLIGERLIAYYEARARAGVGVIIVGTSSVHPTSVSRYQTALVNWDSSVLEGFLALTERLHGFGTGVLLQLNHAGGLSGSPSGVHAVRGPSAVQTELATEMPHALDRDEIQMLVHAYAEAATRAREGGFDGVEVHAGHGNLIQQFLSPLTNERADEYGGGIQSRARFGREVLREVREAVGPDLTVGIRLSVEEDVPSGLEQGDVLGVLGAFVDAGDLDYVSVTSGSDTSSVSLPRHYAPMYMPTGHMRHLARLVKGAVDLPVLVAGRITDPRDAEDILQSRDADLVGVARALIADAEFTRKAKTGQFDAIRYCVGINDGCLGRLFRGLPVTCVQDPTSGRELELGPITPGSQTKRVVVVGAGPAGLEAARVAALRGHHVTLLEQDSGPGGLVRVARQAPGRSEIGAITDHLFTEASRLDVEWRFRSMASAERVLDLEPDAVMIASGSEPALPEFDDQSGRVVAARDAYRTGALIGTPLVVFDTQGDAEGLTTADWLAEKGLSVTVVTSGAVPGWKLDPMTRQMLLERLVSHRVPIWTSHIVSDLTDVGIRLYDKVNQIAIEMEGIATVIAAVGSRARTGLYGDLREQADSLSVVLIGDAYAPRRIEAAIIDGHLAGRGV